LHKPTGSHLENTGMENLEHAVRQFINPDHDLAPPESQSIYQRFLCEARALVFADDDIGKQFSVSGPHEDGSYTFIVSE
jgi:hypothetical protein